MIEFITAHWTDILIGVAVIAITAFLLVRGKIDIVYKMLYSLVNEAEKLFGAKTGKVKFAYVMEKVYAKLPAVIRLVVSYSTLERWIENAVTKMKEDLAEKAEIAE